MSRQLVPSEFADLTADPDRERARRVCTAMMTMFEFDFAALKAAYAGR